MSERTRKDITLELYILYKEVREVPGGHKTKKM